MNNDLQEINKLHRETKFAHTNEKQKVDITTLENNCHVFSYYKQLRAEYEQFIRQLEKQFSQKTDEYEKRIEIIIAKTHEQFKSMEGLS